MLKSSSVYFQAIANNDFFQFNRLILIGNYATSYQIFLEKDSKFAKNLIMDIVTKSDLKAFKIEIVAEIKNLFNISLQASKEYLNSAEVRKLLKISGTKLYELRRYKKIPFIKVGGKYLYPYPKLINNLK